jgi:serine/threonine-protein kinase
MPDPSTHSQRPDEEFLGDLLSAWQRRQEQGEDVPAAELCRDRPELLPELRRRIEAVRRLDVYPGFVHDIRAEMRRRIEAAQPAQAPGGDTVAIEGTSGERPAAPGGVPTTVVPTIAPTRPASPAALPAPPGYEIVRELGRGGMGVVYQARQVALDRPVALKMILAGAYADPGERARFRREAEAIARLQHPHVVQIHEVGEHDGLPYFSLEFCPGGSLAGKLAGTPWAPAPAAQLVETLARAIHAAHERGLVHRDLKPSNVLLTADGTPKIGDFGLAKRLDDPAGPTPSGAVMGTPSYMAPEQAGGRAHRITPAADVYALGAILYELLTGRPPFRGATAWETVGQVLSTEPVPPSQLQPKVPRDMETACLKCLAKEPLRRYASALELADELHRFLEGRPLKARPAGRLERLGRWGRRNPGVAALALALALALAGGAAVSGWQWSRAAAERDVAERQRDEARKQHAQARTDFQRARAAVDKYLTEVSDDPELKARNLEPLRRKLLLSARDYYEHFVQEHPDDPELEAELGRAYGRLGAIAVILESPAGSIEPAQMKRAVFERLHRAHPDEAAYQDDLADSCLRLGTGYHYAGRPQDAEEAFGRARQLWEDLARKHPDNGDYPHALLKVLKNLGRAYQLHGRREEAERAYGDGRAAFARWAEGHPARPEQQASLVLLLTNLGILYGDTGRPALQKETLQEAVSLGEQLVRARPGDPGRKAPLLHALNELGQMHARRGEADAAEAPWRRGEEVSEGLAREHPADTAYQEHVANFANNLGILWHFHRGQPAKALPFYQKALAILERLTRENPGVPHYRGGLHKTYNNLHALLVETGDLAGALALTDRVLDCWKVGPPADKLGGKERDMLSGIHLARGQVLAMRKRYADALPAYDRAGELAAEGNKQRLRLERSLVEGLAQVDKGEHERAAALAQAAVDAAPRDGGLLYMAAEVLALDAAAVARDERLPAAERGRRAEGYAARAVDLLRRAQAQGYFASPANRDNLRTDNDLAFLRSRADFQKLLAGGKE